MKPKLKTTFDDAFNPDVSTEERQWTLCGQTLEPPSSVVYWIECPFCKCEVKAYLWSLSGGGKRCECGAIFSAYGSTYRRVEKEPTP